MILQLYDSTKETSPPNPCCVNYGKAGSQNCESHGKIGSQNSQNQRPPCQLALKEKPKMGTLGLLWSSPAAWVCTFGTRLWSTAQGWKDWHSLRVVTVPKQHQKWNSSRLWAWQLCNTPLSREAGMAGRQHLPAETEKEMPASCRMRSPYLSPLAHQPQGKPLTTTSKSELRSLCVSDICIRISPSETREGRGWKNAMAVSW